MPKLKYCYFVPFVVIIYSVGYMYETCLIDDTSHEPLKNPENLLVTTSKIILYSINDYFHAH